jgi:error-prone DNA polymerase
VTYPLPELEPVLAETYGRILYQDQVLDVVRVVGGYTPDEADAWQKAMTHARSEEEMTRLGLMLYERAKQKGLTGKRFERLWRQIKGFSRYGFCHGHALAFATHAQGTAWLLAHHPAEFFAAILSVEPCGFWPVATVVAEAQRRGVQVCGPCVNRSGGEDWEVEHTADGEGARAIRCSLVYVREIRGAARAVEEERSARGVFLSLVDFARRCPYLTRTQMEWLALAGAFDAFHPNRRQALWSLPVLGAHERQVRRAGERLEATGQQALAVEVPPLLPPGLSDFTYRERLAWEWAAMRFSPDAHPMELYRPSLDEAGVLPCAALQNAAEGAVVTVAGLVLRPHRPPTPSGQVVVYLTLEDETGLAQVTVPPDAYEHTGADIFGEAIVAIRGIAERQGIGLILRATGTQRVG